MTAFSAADEIHLLEAGKRYVTAPARLLGAAWPAAVIVAIEERQARLRLAATRGRAMHFRPITPGVWRIDGDECTEDRRAVGLVVVWLLLYARSAGLSAVPLDATSRSANAMRNALRRAAAWLKPHSAQIAQIVGRMTVTRDSIVMNARSTDAEIICT
jgi:hypothetical protein